MGHDIVPISNHSLDTSNVANLAKDLSKRLQANIEYGYQDSFGHYLEKESTYEDVTLGKITVPGASETYFLRDEHYQLHSYYTEHGEKIFDLDYFQDEERELSIRSVRVELEYIWYSLENTADWSKQYSIHADTLQCEAFYYSRWWDFCRLFTEENDFDIDFAKLNEYRNNLRSVTEFFGGNAMCFFDDQGETAKLIDAPKSWKEIKNAMATEFKNSILEISEFMKEKKLRKEDDYPLAFYDDFADLI